MTKFKKTSPKKGSVIQAANKMDQDLQGAFSEVNLFCLAYDVRSIVPFRTKKRFKNKNAKNVSDITFGRIFPKGAYEE